MTSPLSPEDFVRRIAVESWELFKREALLLVVSSLLATLLTVLSFGLLSGCVSIGCILIVRRLRRGEPASLGDVLQFDHLVGGTLVGLLVALATFLGLALLVVPGLLAMVFCAYAPFGVAYEDQGALASIRASVALVKANFAQVLVLLVGLALLNALAGVATLALVASLPLSLVALTVSYELLTEQSPEPLLPASTRGGAHAP